MDRELISRILNQEMTFATGCTEPACVALTGAWARSVLPGEIRSLTVSASTNILKNAMAAGIPGTPYTGVGYAAALGAVCGRTDRQLMVIDDATKEDIEQAAGLVRGGAVTVLRAAVPEKLYVEVKLFDGVHEARAVVAGSHTNLCLLEKDGEAVITEKAVTEQRSISSEEIGKTLPLSVICAFADTLDRETDDLHMIEQAISVNSHIAELGRERPYGLGIGQGILRCQGDRLMGNDLVTNAVALTACGIDARMAGANAPVVTNSGSGNQGITATVPLLVAAKELGVSEERTFAAVTLSHLVTIAIHSGFGLLSGLCGATIAATGVACGLVYLNGGTHEQIGYAVNNMLADVTGMICDGAKADCAMKVSTCIYAAFRSASMALHNEVVKSTDGIVETDPEKTIRNFVILGNEGSQAMDDLVLEMMLKKKNL